MKYALKYTIAATLAAGAAAAGHQHGHQHFHAKKDVASPVERREADEVVQYVVAATETVYELAGEQLDADEAKDGLDSGSFIVIGESTPSYTPPPPPPPPKPTTSTSADFGAKFIESKSKAPETTSTTSSTTSTSTTSSAPPPPPKPTHADPPKKNPPTTGGGLNSKFPSGEIKCSTFPSAYGAVPLKWLGFSGWSGIQRVPDYSKNALSILEIHTGISGDGCEEKSMCTYACPPGYQPSQWPDAQGSTKESIGGLYCNADGYLELTRDSSDVLCEKGAGGVTIKNDLKKVVATCRTVYPGTESMVIPATANPGETVELCNPLQDEFKWDDLPTSAQYYVNKAGLSTEQGCVWNSDIDPEGAGNWAPIIIGVGKAADGITYMSIFQNLPTSTAKLNFNIEIKGDVNSKCSYINGVFSGNGDGCTVSNSMLSRLLSKILTIRTDGYEGGWQGCHPLLLSQSAVTWVGMIGQLHGFNILVDIISASSHLFQARGGLLWPRQDRIYLYLELFQGRWAYNSRLGPALQILLGRISSPRR